MRPAQQMEIDPDYIWHTPHIPTLVDRAEAALAAMTVFKELIDEYRAMVEKA